MTTLKHGLIIVFSVSWMTSLHISTCLQAIIKVSESFVDNEATALIQKYSTKLFAISLYNIVLE